PEDIPAVTQLFTPHWIVRYMVENSLGRLWMLNHPDSQLVERMDYYIPPPQDEVDGGGRADRAQGTVHRPEGESARNGESSLSTDHRPLSTSVPLITSPEDIRLCDPACGSGHILTYAFDLLVAIYEEQGYNPVEIPRLILEKNLTGIEIDERAGALAGFALMMKARARDRRFFRRRDSGRPVLPNIVVMEDVVFTPQELDAYMDAVGRDLFTQSVRDWLQQFEQAKLLGSLIRPLVTDTTFIRERLYEMGIFQDLFLSNTNHKLRAVLRMTEALAPSYHIVLANPPYMGSSGMPPCLKDYAKEGYSDSNSDLCTMFIERNLHLVCARGFVSMITMMSWMFLSSFQGLRRKLLGRETIETMAHLGPHAFDTISGEIVSTTTFTIRHEADAEYQGQYFRLVEGNSESDKAQMLRGALRADHAAPCTYRYSASATDFKEIPGAPIAYWTSDRIRAIFGRMKSLDQYASIGKGLDTGDNSRFLRLWHEVGRPFAKWVPCLKGGRFRKWYGNHSYVINWEDDGREFREFPKSNLRNAHNYFKAGITWSRVSSGAPSFRLFPTGFIFESTGPCLFPHRLDRMALASFLNSNLASTLLEFIAPTLDFQSGHISKLPILPSSFADVAANENAQLCQTLAKDDWDAYESSWDFLVHPMLRVPKIMPTIAQEPWDRGRGESAYAAYANLRHEWLALTKELQQLEEQNNRFFVDSYSLQGDINPEVPITSVTLTSNPHYRYGSSRLRKRAWEGLSQQFPEICKYLSAIAAETAPDMPEEDRLGLEQRLLDDTMREFISYAVGCMFGRYSLDKPG
ncbi:MAG: BREX-1 system adenine-specific DNA-methyltransferase PglX, partial [Chloroflexi bacterium]|nr:BREX-1 system adenine-specific DNA-methyltransferase PglX [Chloroflexota bacterium]